MFSTTYNRIKHKLTARYSYGFGVHSPFLFSFTKYVIYEKNPFYIFIPIESLYRELKKDKALFLPEKGFSTKEKKQMLGSENKRCRQLLFRVANLIQPQSILEIGSSFGITTTYLASASPKAKCVSIGELQSVAHKAQEVVDCFQLENTSIVTADIKEELDAFIEKEEKVDLICIHSSIHSAHLQDYLERCLSLVHEKSILILSGIHTSKEKRELRKAIKKNERVTASIDLFQMEILFFRKDFQTKEYKMRF